MIVEGSRGRSKGAESSTQSREIEAMIDLNLERATGITVLAFDRLEKFEFECMFFDVFLYAQSNGQICFQIYPPKNFLQ